jgi:hypothetical protein
MQIQISTSSNEDSLIVEAGIDMIPGTLSEFGQIVHTNLKPVVAKARANIDNAIKHTSVKIKAWAMEHMMQAQKLGRRTDLFEKLLNDSESATRQLAYHLLGAPPEIAQKHVSEVMEEKKMDDLLGSIGL